MIDLHSHILPSIDDGSRNMEETIEMIKEAQKSGFDSIVSTSHYYLGHFEEDESSRKQLIEDVLKNLKDSNINMDIFVGNEIYITHQMVDLLKEHKASTLNNSRYVLFELPFVDRIHNLNDFIYNLISNNYIPIIAHPERYKYVQKDPNILIDLINIGVLFQSNYGSIIGQYGKEAQKAVTLLIKNNFIHFLGSDVHRKENIYKAIPSTLEKLKEITTKEKIEELTTINPRLVIENKGIDIRQPNRIKKNFLWF